MKKVARSILVALIGYGCLMTSSAKAFQLGPHSTWDVLDMGSDCYTFAFQNVDYDEMLRPWFESCRTNLLRNSNSEQKDLSHHSLCCSFNLTQHGVIENLKIKKSSGSREIDEKALGIITRATFRTLRLPPNTDPFFRKILVHFTDDGRFISLKIARRNDIESGKPELSKKNEGEHSFQNSLPK